MSPRDNKIDVLKGMLTLGMVFAHTIQFLDGSYNPILQAVSTYTNLVSFSGFLGCFGFACWIAYLSKQSIPWKKVSSTVVKCYFAFVLSGIAFRYFVSGQSLDLEGIMKIVGLRDIPGYSEFLIAFALITVASCIFAPLLRLLVADIRRVCVFSLAILVFAQFLPQTFIYDPWIGLLLGGSEFSYFPIVLYSPIFVIGAWIAHSQHKYSIISLSAAIVLVLIFSMLTFAEISVDRFPPDAIWLIASSSLAYIYLGLSIFITDKCPRWIKLYLNSVGQNVLYYLLFSNIVLFICYYLGVRGTFTTVQTCVAYFCLMGIIYFSQWISVDFSSANRAVKSNLK
ncbi:hypothetical protein [Gayadomonas joobiniege]|uniref:hypothetical protein n=1 Tax=Gayadomonas joobiniege TaxID=1234606 RepID=UPI00035E6F7B|nr:hypothetical protein [Gayadomonas joobiniege]